MTTTLDKLKNSFVPSVLAGAASVGLYYMIYDKNIGMPAPFGPLEVTTAVAIGSSVAIGNMVGELAVEFIGPKITNIALLQGMGEEILPPITAALGSYATMYVFVSDQTLFMPAVVVGAGGSVVGKYIYGMI